MNTTQHNSLPSRLNTGEKEAINSYRPKELRVKIKERAETARNAEMLQRNLHHFLKISDEGVMKKRVFYIPGLYENDEIRHFFCGYTGSALIIDNQANTLTVNEEHPGVVEYMLLLWYKATQAAELENTLRNCRIKAMYDEVKTLELQDRRTITYMQNLNTTGNHIYKLLK